MAAHAELRRRLPHSLAHFLVSLRIRLPCLHPAEDDHGGCRSHDAGSRFEPAADQLHRAGIRHRLCDFSDAGRCARTTVRGAPHLRGDRPGRLRSHHCNAHRAGILERHGSVRGALRRAARSRPLPGGYLSRVRRGVRGVVSAETLGVRAGIPNHGTQLRPGLDSAAHRHAQLVARLAAGAHLEQHADARSHRTLGLVRPQHAARASVDDGAGARGDRRPAQGAFLDHVETASVARRAIAMCCCCSSPTCA